MASTLSFAVDEVRRISKMGLDSIFCPLLEACLSADAETTQEQRENKKCCMIVSVRSIISRQLGSSAPT